MVTLKIICEGNSEKVFSNYILKDYFEKLNIKIVTKSIDKSGGGIVNWSNIKAQVEKNLKENISIYVTTFIDLYGIKNKHKYPKWDDYLKMKESKNMNNLYKTVISIEEGMKNEINEKIRYRFIPYIQIHEFEALLFNDIKFFKLFDDSSLKIDYFELEKILRDYTNPELINTNKETAPSKRLSKNIDGYEKIIHGTFLAKKIGLTEIRKKCLHFNEWIGKIEGLNK